MASKNSDATDPLFRSMTSCLVGRPGWQTHFGPRLLFAAVALIAITLVLGACYSVEFFPDDDYPNLRRENTEDVRIVRSSPNPPYHRLGVLVIRDYTGDLANPNFLARVRREARRRGASGAWIQRSRIYEQTTFNANTRTRRQGSAGVPQGSGSLRGQIGVVRIILFNRPRPPAAKDGKLP